MNLERTVKSLERNGYQVSVFKTAAEASAYLNREIDQKSVAFGGTVTLRDMGLYETLGTHNEVIWHWYLKDGETPQALMKEAMTTDIYLTSVNAISETGELINIDGTGNRVSSTLYGHEKVYFVAGVNKIASDLAAAVERARNIAAPLNAQRLARKTPCAAKVDQCYDCSSPERICNAMVVHFKKMGSCDMEIVLIEEELGY